MHTDRSVYIFPLPQRTSQIGVEPIRGRIRITSVAQASATGGFQVGAYHDIHPFLAPEGLEIKIKDHVAPANNRGFQFYRITLIPHFRRHLIPFLEYPTDIHPYTSLYDRNVQTGKDIFRLIASRLMIFPPKLHFTTAGQASSYQLGNRKGIWPEITGRVSQILYLFPPF